jgi:hypothetical protein
MEEKRKHVRYKCRIKAQFKYFETNEDENSLEKTQIGKGKGTILDISQNGLLIATNSKISINIPVIITFKIKKDAHEVKGRVVRTGFLENNPSEIAKKFSNFAVSADIYIAVQFDELIEQFKDGDL